MAAIGKAQAIMSEDVLDEKEKARVGHVDDTLKDVSVPIAALNADDRALTPRAKERGTLHKRGERLGRLLLQGSVAWVRDP